MKGFVRLTLNLSEPERGAVVVHVESPEGDYCECEVNHKALLAAIRSLDYIITQSSLLKEGGKE